MKTEKRRIGDVGEGIACQFLMKHGFEVLERNYLRKWGEIDIITRKDKKFHFVEVKTVIGDLNVIRETADRWRPEENVHPGKLGRISRTVQTYILEKNLANDWQFDVITVVIDSTNRRTRVTHIKDIVL